MTATISRADHLDWCKRRALEYVDANDLDQAMASMLSDLNKHDETRGHAGGEIMLMLKMGGRLTTASEMREFINGFN